MKKVALIVAYWLAAIFLTAFLLMSLDYDLGHAVVMSLSFLPAAMALSFFLPKVERSPDRRERLLASIFIILGVMTATFFLIYLSQVLFVFVIDRLPRDRHGWHRKGTSNQDQSEDSATRRRWPPISAEREVCAC